MIYEHKITFIDNSVYIVPSANDYLNSKDCKFLENLLGIDWRIHLKKIESNYTKTTNKK